MSDLEEGIAKIWRDVLRVEHVGPHDNFFDLGGNSILAIKILSEISKKLNLKFSFKQFFSFQNIRTLLDSCSDINYLTSPQPLRQSYPLSPKQRWFFFQKFKNPHYFNQTFLIKISSDILSKDLSYQLINLCTSIQSINICFIKNQKIYTQTIIEKPKIKNRIKTKIFDKDLSDEDLINLESLIIKDINIYSGSLYSIFIIENTEKKSSYVLFCFHHLVMDTSSFKYFLYLLDNLLQNKDFNLSFNKSYLDWSDYLDKLYKSNFFDKEDFLWQSRSKKFEKKPYYEDKLQEKLFTDNFFFRFLKLNIEEISILDVIIYSIAEINLLSEYQIFLEVDASISNSNHDLKPKIGFGWHTLIYPIDVKLEDSILKSLENIKAERLKTPYDGIGFMLQTYSNNEEYDPKNTPTMILINDGGYIDNTKNDYNNFEILDVSFNNFSKKNSTDALLEINFYKLPEGIKFDIILNKEFLSIKMYNIIKQKFLNNISKVLSIL
jgi:acyl carrier protein